MKPRRGADGHRQAPLAGDNSGKQTRRTKRERRKKDHQDGDREPKKRKRQKQHRYAAATAPILDSNSTDSNQPNNHSKGAKQQQQQIIALRDGLPRQLDPLLLARGMSSRYLSAKVSHQLTPLPKDSIEKDLCHMEAYGNTCNAYDQQRFMHENQELVTSGYFGTFAPFPGADGDLVRPDAAAALGVPSAAPFALPIKIDPEEEKRAALLRKQIPRSEREREQREADYLSLRAHYVYESRRARRARAYERGRWRLLRELLARRGRALGLRRAQVAVGRDAARLLRRRGGAALAAARARNGVRAAVGATAVGTARVTANGAGKKAGNKGGISAISKVGDARTADPSTCARTSEEAVDLGKIWNDIGAELRDAKVACEEIETPAVLSEMVMGSSGDLDPRTSMTSSNAGRNSGRRLCSPTKATKAGRNDFSNSNNNSNNNNSSSDSDSKGDDDGDGDGDGDKGNTTESGDGNVNSNSSSNSKKSSGKKSTSKNPIPLGLEPCVIPWDCTVEPRTPYGFPLFFSCLSRSTDKTVAYATGETNPTPLTWLKSTLPVSTAAYATDASDLAKLRKEVRGLEVELDRESKRNTELQKRVVVSRSRSNEMVSMMQVLRSEMATSLERHNLIMETPEARARAKTAQLRKKLMKEKSLKKISTEKGRQAESGEEGEIHDEDEEENKSGEDSVGKITTRDSSNKRGGKPDTEGDDDTSEQGEVVENKKKKLMEEKGDKVPRRSKRRTSHTDKGSSLLTRRNYTNSYRRRRI